MGFRSASTTQDVLLALCLLFSGAAVADTIGIHTATLHVGSQEKRYATATTGLYWRRDDGLTVGAYRNSERRASAYAAWTWEAKPFALTAGLVTGYRRAPVMPVVVPSVALPIGDGMGFMRDRMAIRLAWLPKPSDFGATGFHLAFELKYVE